jgi:hypothetical protein
MSLTMGYLLFHIQSYNTICCPMYNNRTWRIMNWNLRGINLEKNWLAHATKIQEIVLAIYWVDLAHVYIMLLL